MSGMDRLMELLSRASECFKHHGVAGGLAADIDDALTDHRRASQAAPAPSDGLREGLERAAKVAENLRVKPIFVNGDVTVKEAIRFEPAREEIVCTICGNLHKIWEACPDDGKASEHYEWDASNAEPMRVIYSGGEMSGMDRLTELLPCPFCGDPMRVVLGNLQHTKNARDSRHDSICPIRACSWTSGSIAAWNRRASQAAPAPSDGLREARDIALKAIADMEGAGPFTEQGRDDDWRFRARLARKEALDAAQAHIMLAFDRAALSASPAQEGDRRHD